MTEQKNENPGPLTGEELEKAFEKFIKKASTTERIYVTSEELSRLREVQAALKNYHKGIPPRWNL